MARMRRCARKQRAGHVDSVSIGAQRIQARALVESLADSDGF